MLEILALGYFGKGSACLGMPDRTQQISRDLTKASMDILLNEKKKKKKKKHTSNSILSNLTVEEDFGL